MIKRLISISSRSQFGIYTLGFISGALLVYSLSRSDHLCQMEKRTERYPITALRKIQSEYSYPSEILLNDHVTSENAGDSDLKQENARGTVRLEVNRKQDEFKPEYLKEPIDAHGYNYIHNPNYTCFSKNGKNLDIIILFLALTAPKNFKRREAIRATYGNASNWRYLSKYKVMRTVFLLGATSNATLQRRINSEASLHGDIIQEDFVDSYMNLTRKTVMGLKWVTNHCRHARYAMKIDDDTMMNQRRFLMTVLRTNAPLSNYTAGNALIGTKTVRKKSSKFYLSEKYYPSPTFPPYMDGPAYLLSLDIVEQAYKAALTTPLFKWEDAFVGMCLEKAGVHVQGFERFLLFRLSTTYDEYEREKKAKSYTFVSNLSADEMRWMWNLCRM